VSADRTPNSLTTAWWLFGYQIVQRPDYASESRAQLDDAWERPPVSRSGPHALWDRDGAWLADVRRHAVPWASELLALPYLYAWSRQR
jgi:hypothetical protein